MSNRLKKVIKNQWVKVKGFYHTKNMRAIKTNFDCCVTNDEVGNWLIWLQSEAEQEQI